MTWIGWVACILGGTACMSVMFLLVLLAFYGQPWGLAAAASGAIIGWWVPWLVATRMGFDWNRKRKDN